MATGWAACSEEHGGSQGSEGPCCLSTAGPGPHSIQGLSFLSQEEEGEALSCPGSRPPLLRCSAPAPESYLGGDSRQLHHEDWDLLVCLRESSSASFELWLPLGSSPLCLYQYGSLRVPRNSIPSCPLCPPCPPSWLQAVLEASQGQGRQAQGGSLGFEMSHIDLSAWTRRQAGGGSRE